jgi:hypothetical protein
MYERKELPELAKFEEGRKCVETYKIFCLRFLPGVIGCAVFKNGCCTAKLSDYSTITDEAMTFLILANNWDPWTKMIELKKEGTKEVKKLQDCGVKQKYFEETKGRGHSWNDDGKLYYNDMYDKIAADRITNGVAFDEYFLNDMMDNSEEGKRLSDKKNKKPSVRTKRAIECRRDLPPTITDTKISTSCKTGITDYGVINRSICATRNETISAKKPRYNTEEEQIATEHTRNLGATRTFSGKP